jgi:phospholipid/cholesterol/gamma-HCH transport system permease protein
MGTVGALGESLLRKLAALRDVGAVVGGVLYLAVQPRYWPRTVREIVGRQVLFTGFDALGLVLAISLLTGVSVVAQVQLWLSRFGQSDMLGDILVAVLVSEVGPLLVNFIVIGRSGTAIATELATMRVHGEIALLDAQGADPMAYLVMPRVVGMTLSVLGLTVVFVAGAFVSGYVFGQFTDVRMADPARFAQSVLGAVKPSTIVNLLVKTLVPGMTTATICCLQGLRVQGAATEVPQAATRAVVHSIATLLLITAICSVLTYV